VPDFLVRTSDGDIYVVETKGRVDIDVPRKMQRLAQWCADATAASRAEGGPAYRFVYVDQVGFEKYRPNMFSGLVSSFTEYQETAR
jgi:type III restriction enzyme